MQILGIDIGGTGVKGAPVDIESGELIAPRVRLPTPVPARPNSVADVVAEIVHNFQWNGPVGIGFPGIVRAGFTQSAANVHKKWINLNARELFTQATGCPVMVINDADAAGLAEMTFGAGKGHGGVVMLVTIGTGLGTALFTSGHLVPNTELGHIEINGTDAELNASDAARKRDKLSWKKWAQRLNSYLGTLERLFSPDLFILGGGISKEHARFIPLLTLQAEVVPAQLLNEAGVIGAALAASRILE